MRTFYLGFKKAGSGRLTEFNSAREAEYLAEEWAEVQAPTLKEAKQEYEKNFLIWQESAGLKV